MYVTQEKLDSAYSEVRQTFFPEWDPKGEWRAWIWHKWRPGVGSCQPAIAWGYFAQADTTSAVCETLRKILWIKPRQTASVALVLIHEICHAIADEIVGKEVGHGAEWQEQVERAARIADKCRSRQFAQAIRREKTQVDRVREKRHELLEAAMRD